MRTDIKREKFVSLVVLYVLRWGRCKTTEAFRGPDPFYTVLMSICFHPDSPWSHRETSRRSFTNMWFKGSSCYSTVYSDCYWYLQLHRWLFGCCWRTTKKYIAIEFVIWTWCQKTFMSRWPHKNANLKRVLNFKRVTWNISCTRVLTVNCILLICVSFNSVIINWLPEGCVWSVESSNSPSEG